MANSHAEHRSVLTLNSGSSSIKFAIFEDGGDAPRRGLSGKIDRIGLKDATLSVKTPDGRAEQTSLAAPDHRAAIDNASDWLRDRGYLHGGASFAAVGHRIVHGGPKYSKPEIVTPELVEELRRISPLAPEHLPSAISVLDVALARFQVPHVACFDTAFHRDMPRVAKIIPLPRRFEEHGVQRYGFHGISYQYLMGELARLDPTAARGRVILAHFGNGASLAAAKGGKGIDTSMGFTPAAGIPMSRRTGDIDPGIVWYLSRVAGVNAEQFHKIVNHESGLLGVSGVSPDMRDLLEREARGDANCADAVNLFCYQARKWIGAFAAALGGVETIVFAGGIGENAPAVRERVCEGLGFLGVNIERSRNDSNAPIISSDSSRVAVRVIPTDEEVMIAKEVYRLTANSVQQ